MTDSDSLLSAILAVQAEAPTLPKDKTAKVRMKSGGEYTYNYTDLATVVEQVGPKLTDHGLVWMSKPGFDPHGNPTLRYKLAHVPTGESEEGEMPLMLPAEGADSQALGSALTYARRYALCAVLNLVADDDDDGQAAKNHPAGRTSQSASPSDKQLDYLKSLIGREKPSEAVLRALLARVEADGVDPTKDGWSKALNRAQVSQLIEAFKDGVLPVGGSDIPTDDDVPFDVTAPA